MLSLKIMESTLGIVKKIMRMTVAEGQNDMSDVDPSSISSTHGPQLTKELQEKI